MPAPSPKKRISRAKRTQPFTPDDRPERAASAEIVLIDQSRLQRAAWAEFHTAQKRHEKAGRDLHRHEEVDTPAYEQWLNQTFPALLTELRNLQEEVTTKTAQIRMIRAMAAYTGRSPKRLWEQFQAEGPDAFGSRDDDAERKARNHRPDDDFFDRDEPPPYRGRGQAASDRVTAGAARRASGPARDIYRRLVQKLHPDRGGEFTPARKRLWHEVQQAWAQGDADWLARLEVELDSNADLGLLGLTDAEPLTVKSPLSRLRRALAELQAARRDTERKLAEYRKTPPWRFTLTPKKRAVLARRTQKELEADLVRLERQANHLRRTIEKWEEPSLGDGGRRFASGRD